MSPSGVRLIVEPAPLDLTSKRIAIVAHVLKYAEADDLLTFVLERGAAQAMFIGHPLSYVEGRPGPRLRLFSGGALRREVILKNRRLPGPLQYLRDTVLTLYWVMKTRRRWDLIVACDNLNALAAIILRRIGLARRVVYYTIDFVPRRFANSRMNDAYHRLDRFCVSHADVTWNVSDRIAEGREQVRGLDRSVYDRQITVPIGGWFQRLARTPFSEIEHHSLVYSGGLLPHQGIGLMLGAIPAIAATMSDFHLHVTGLGPLEQELKDTVRELGVRDHVTFHGYIESHARLHELLAGCAAGVAMYSAELDLWSRFAEPAKIKLYLSAGLPVFTTDVTYIAPQIALREAGLVLPFDSAALADAVIELVGDEARLRRFRANALAFGSEFDWPVIFTRALSDPRLGLVSTSGPA